MAAKLVAWIRMEAITILAVSLGAGLVGGLWLGIIGPEVTRVRADVGGPTPSSTWEEVPFLKEMSGLQTGEADLARLCARKAVHEEIRPVCTQMARLEQVESDQMQTWLKEWHQLRYHPHPSAVDRTTANHIDRLQGEKLEKALISELIQRHTGGMNLASECVRQSTTPALTSACQNILIRQSAETVQLQAWLCDWYGVCRQE